MAFPAAEDDPLFQRLVRQAHECGGARACGMCPIQDVCIEHWDRSIVESVNWGRLSDGEYARKREQIAAIQRERISRLGRTGRSRTPLRR